MNSPTFNNNTSISQHAKVDVSIKIEIEKLVDEFDEEAERVFLSKSRLQKIVNQTFGTTKITSFGAEGVLEEKYPAIWNVWIRKLKEKKISLKVIYNETSRHLREKKKIDVIEQRYIERKTLTNVTTQIMDEQVNLFHWDEIPLIVPHLQYLQPALFL